MLPNPQQFADEWIESWNSHDIEKILEHYSEDFEITTPMLQKLLGDGRGALKGKSAVRKYWKDALQKVSDLHFVLLDVTRGVDSIALYYKSVLNTKAIEVMFFDDKQKIYRVLAHYT